MMPLNYIFRIYAGSYKLYKSQEKLNHLTYINIKLFAKNEKEFDTIILAMRLYSQDIRVEFNREKCTKPILGS